MNFEYDYDFELRAKFSDWQRRPPFSLEDHLTKNNAQGYDALFTRLEKHCLAPGCRYPLRATDNFQIMNLGEVCYLCYCMHKIVSLHPWFVTAQREYEEQKRKKKDGGFFGRSS